MKNKILKNIGALFLGFLIAVVLTLVTSLPYAHTGGKLFESKNKTVYHG